MGVLNLFGEVMTWDSEKLNEFVFSKKQLTLIVLRSINLRWGAVNENCFCRPNDDEMGKMWKC